MTTFLYTWNAGFDALPDDTENASQGAQRIRDLKAAFIERVTIDHYWEASGSDGWHKQVTMPVLAVKPTVVATQGALYTKTTAGRAELFYEDDTGAEVQITLAGTVGSSTGDVKLTVKTTADAGWVMMDDKSIGDASSSATGRANADTVALFTLLWTNIADAYCPVSGGRGVSAAADFAAHKTLTLPRTLGRALGIAGSGAGLTARALGQYLGEETHQLSTAELPSHTHTVTDPGHGHSITDPGHHHSYTRGASYNSGGGGALANNPTADVTGNATTGITVNSNTTGISVGSVGSDTAHNNMQPTSFINAMVKL